MSFTRAADELHVTQTAISHQIKGLEERLGVRLFRRLPRGLLLTEEAQRYLPPVRNAFDQIAAATEQLATGGSSGSLTVSVLPSFAAKWLVPRLGRFRAAHPDLDLRVSASSQLVDFARDDVDVGIRMGRGTYPGLRVDQLFGESLVPVCSPELLRGPHPLRRPEDLREHVLLHDDDHTDWQLWLELAGVAGGGRKTRPDVHRLRHGRAGRGRGSGRGARPERVGRGDLAAGRLVRLFEVSVPHDLAYYLVSPEATAEQPRIRAFRAWLLGEAKERRPAAASAA